LPTVYNEVDRPVGALSEWLAGAAKEPLEPIGFLETLIEDRPIGSTTAGSGSSGRVLFEQLGFSYTGPVDGHDMDALVGVLSDIKQGHSDGSLDKPILLHIKTKKGNGYVPAEQASDKLHAVKPRFNLPKAIPAVAEPESRESKKAAPLPLTTVMANALVKEAERDEKIVAITAAMPGGTGIGIFEKRFGPERTFDVGIAEQHAVTFAAGLAAGGVKPFCAIYSSFLQRAFDQVMHDVALQNLPVRFVIDRAGLVGADGPTHGGAFDLTFLGCLPNLAICAPANEVELVHMIHTLAKIDDRPSAVRFPRGSTQGLELPAEPLFLEPGKGRVVREGRITLDGVRDGSLAILSIGARLDECLKAASVLEEAGIATTVADMRWVKPLDTELVTSLAASHRAVLTVEENSIGGFAAQVQQVLLEAGYLDGDDEERVTMRSMMLPDRFIDHHHDPYMQYEDAELNAAHIVSKANTMLSSIGVIDSTQSSFLFNSISHSGSL
jgi:1-deoxy-D-xylulose-5-phosphate synthase